MNTKEHNATRPACQERTANNTQTTPTKHYVWLYKAKARQVLLAASIRAGHVPPGAYWS